MEITKSELNKLTKFYKALGDPVRIKLVKFLMDDRKCVHEISKYLNLEQSLTSHQLRKLRDACIIKSEREGKYVFYSLDDKHVSKIIEQALIHIKHIGKDDE